MTREKKEMYTSKTRDPKPTLRKEQLRLAFLSTSCFQTNTIMCMFLFLKKNQKYLFVEKKKVAEEEGEKEEGGNGLPKPKRT